MERTCFNTNLSLKDVGKNVTLIGWVAKKRNLGGLLFIDLRDRSGIIQILVNDKLSDVDIRNEYVIQVKGSVNKKDVPNKNLKTGEIEILATEINVINKAETTPLIIDDKTDALEDTRLKYRYLDLRRPIMQEKLMIRANIVKCVHAYLDSHDFIEVETPLLTRSTPEGARDYIVPSRLHHGAFYALPQSPQIYKQLLMIGGMERYYQVARCFRDEDLRADRQPDFTQIDIETSFLDEDQILSLMEGLLQNIFKTVKNVDIQLPLRRMEYRIAIDEYGSDKPDTRFDMKLKNVKDILENSTFEPFKTLETIKAIKVEGVASETSRKVIDKLQLEAKKFSLNGVTVLKVENNTLVGSFVKFLNEEIMSELMTRLDLHDNDIAIIAASNEYNDVCSALGAFRVSYARQLGLIKPNTYDLFWVNKFPLFEKSKETGKITSSHHPFTRPCDENLNMLDEDPLKVLTYAYDIIINGYEAGGGSLRIHDQDVQKKVFNILGLDENTIARKFGFFVDAFKYGTPPHGGIAFGLDRLTMILSGTDNIRDVIAFPKNLSASCPMSSAPNVVDDEQLVELGIKIADEH